jgi:hypothetical protein
MHRRRTASLETSKFSHGFGRKVDLPFPSISAGTAALGMPRVTSTLGAKLLTCVPTALFPKSASAPPKPRHPLQLPSRDHS